MNDAAKELLKKAEDRIFSLGLRDLASALSYKNMRYGLGKMLHVAESAYSIFGPDSTITRNKLRWFSGFGYGAIIRWEPKGIYFPEIRPNGCGMILIKLDELPSRKSILERLSEANNKELSLDGIEIKPDFGKGNHFLEFYSVTRVQPEIESKIPRESHYALIHGSAGERKDEIYGMVDEGTWQNTPLGRISVLDGAIGKEYYRKWLSFESFSIKKRELIAKEILPEGEVVTNVNHQGMFSSNEIRLGCHDTMDKNYPLGEALFPIALRWDHPLYIFQGKENLTDEVLGMMSFAERAKDLGIYEKLKNINILPHGGGYDVKMPYTRIEVLPTDIGNMYSLSGIKPVTRVEEMSTGGIKGLSKFGEMIVSNPHDLPYDYRGIKVIEKTMEYDLATLVAMLQPLMTIKI